MGYLTGRSIYEAVSQLPEHQQLALLWMLWAAAFFMFAQLLVLIGRDE